MTPLCAAAARDPQWWSPTDDGARLALALCRVCPVRSGDSCAPWTPDRRPRDVIRAGVAWSEEGHPLPICVCGYPNTRDQRGRRPDLPCVRCKVPVVRSWVQQWEGRRRYWAERHARKKAA